MDTIDQPNSICHVQSIQVYQLPSVEATAVLPFKLVTGEAVFQHGTSVDGLIVLTNYRLYLQVGNNHHHVPLGLIDAVEHRDLFYLQVGCKDARTYRCIFGNNETCQLWYDRIMKAAEPPRQLEQLFAFYHFIWAKDKGGDEVDEKIRNLKQYTFDHRLFKDEMTRLQFTGDSWRISDANQNYKLCPTYPPYLIVPSCINDDMLECVAKFRSSRRIPAIVWRHSGNGAVIARCSQPEVGWLGWRSGEDEDLMKAISQACNFDQRPDKDGNLSHSPGSLHSEDSLQLAGDVGQVEKKVLIMDARSYTTAVANRARGGGCECPEYYPNCDIQFMNLANIHSIRKSFHALRLLCGSSADQANWFSQLESTRWLQHMSGLMKASVTLVNAVERDGRPVMVHCSDGWDRTPQIIALAELLLDPYYRTIDGFRILIEREWLAFGHKFADRCGHSTGSDDQNERCPVFLQWLDCVHQLLLQFSCAFEFSHTYLVKMAQHIYSNLYGTFLCNTFQERMRIVNEKTFSVWEFLSSTQFKNHLYAPPGNSCGNKILWPQCNVRDLHLWSEVYLGSWEDSFSALEGSSGACPGPPETSPSHMTKTRSYGDLINAPEASVSQYRRSSDPSINNIDKKLNGVVLENGDDVRPNTNGHFLANDEIDCNTDCIYKNVVITPIIQPSSDEDEEDSVFLQEHVINGDKTDSEDCIRPTVCLLTDELAINGTEDDSDNELTEKSESRSEKTVCGLVERSVETSTDTLVLDGNNFSSSPLEVNGFEKVQSPGMEGTDSDGCKVCAQNLRFVNDPHSNHKTSKYSASPLYSRTSSCSGWDNGLPQHRTWQTHPITLGDDGLAPVRSTVQDRMWQVIQGYRMKEELLERELHTYRQALIKQFCHKCCNNEIEKIDDTSDDSVSESSSNSSPRLLSPVNEPSSVIESVCSAGEGPTSAVESLRSDMSWEALEENSILSECTATLWVPDHAVSRCTGCQTEFWVGKRKHHCRKCGRIFCASCSENSTPLPSEQLYNPVRVCTACYSKLRRDCGGEVPDHCKHTNTQITASSN